MSNTQINNAQPDGAPALIVGGLKLAPTIIATPSGTVKETRRWGILAYGATCYLVFFANFLYAIGFMGGFWVPETLAVVAPGTVEAWLVDVALLGAFAVQHSVMARPGFKRLWTQIIPEAGERSTYVLFSSLALFALFAFWQPLGGLIWSIESEVGSALAYAGFAFGWVLVFASSCLINHFDLFGLRQVWLAFNNRPYTDLQFVTPWPYRVVRHPLYLGWLFAMWCTPFMTMSHFVFAALSTAYIFIGIALEERDLRNAHPNYKEYADQVPMIFPRLSMKPVAPKPALAN